MKKVAKSFSEGDLVFAKVRGYPAWPARITSPADAKGTRYNVFFYGTYETAVCKPEEIWLLTPETKAKLGKQKRKGFKEALQEIEENPNIALEISTSAVNEVEPVDTTMDETADASTLDTTTASSPTTPAPKKRPNKRKAEDSPSELPPAKQAKTKPDKVSRSGRVIKEKKLETPVKTTGESPRVGQKKMWVCMKSTGDLIEINLDRDRPNDFDSKEKELQWERGTAINAIKFKSRVESGLFLPDELRQKIKSTVSLTPQEEEMIAIEKKMGIRQEKVRFLKAEQRLVDIDIELQETLDFENPDMSKALDLLAEIQQMSIAPLMFKKQPQLVETIRQVRKYVGPKVPSDDPREAKESIFLAEKIRVSSDHVFEKIRNAFGELDESAFLDHFAKSVDDFKEATKTLDEKKVAHLVADPSNKVKAE